MKTVTVEMKGMINRIPIILVIKINKMNIVNIDRRK